MTSDETTTKAEVIQYLEDTLAIFEDGAKWGKGSYMNDETGCRCLVGGLWRWDVPGTDQDDELFASERVSERALLEALEDRQYSHDAAHVQGKQTLLVRYNDRPETQWVHIKTLIEDAIEKVRDFADIA